MDYTLERTGNSPVIVKGDLLTTFKSRNATIEPPANDHRQWYLIDLYRTASGKFVAHAKYRAGAKLGTEQPVNIVFSGESMFGLLDALDALCPSEEFATGWPGDPNRVEFHNRMMRFAAYEWEDILKSVESYCVQHARPELID